MERKPMRDNLLNVAKFEITRNLKKPFFWVAALILPILLVGYIALAGLVGYSAGTAIEGSASDTSSMELGVFDAVDYLSSLEITNSDGAVQKLKSYNSAEQGISDVKEGKLGVFYYIPENFAETLTIETYAKTENFSIFTSYDTPIRSLLDSSASERVDPMDFAVISGSVQINSINFSVDNAEIDPIAQISRMVIPVAALAVFYILICLFGNRLTTAMTEEKENRISEMILTSMSPRDLITGKIISLIILGFIQLAALIIPLIIVAALGFAGNIVPEGFFIDLSAVTVLSSLVLLIVSYFLFTGLCVTISAIAPTAKDASSFAGVIIILTILPLFFINSFLSPESATPITYILSYFPPSAPIALMFRNAFGTLPVWELILGLACMAFASFVTIKLAVFIYTRSALEFTSRVNLRAIFSKSKK
jgi:ABC-2 type transport system permease protein